MKHIVIKLIFTIFCLLIISNGTTWAHPHVFIEQNLKIVFDEKGMAGFNVHWKFDDMFSSMICEDHDVNKMGFLKKQKLHQSRKKPLPILLNLITLFM